MSSSEVDAMRRDLINEQLQIRFLEPQLRNLIAGAAMVIAVAAFLWNQADRVGLVVWAALVVLTLAGPTVVRWVDPPFRTFYPVSVALEVLSGLAWGLGAFIAMPRETIWQALLLTLFIGLLMSGGPNMAQFYGVFAAFQLPFAVLVAVGFLVQDDWPRAQFLVIWSIGLIYVTANAYEARLTQIALVSGNLDLGAANQLLDTQARTDTLTGLANRLEFTDRLEADIAAMSEQAGRGPGGRSVTLGYLDIDRFKHINDEYGHHVGDELLRQSAERLMAAATENELVARLGGDELTVLSSVDADSLGARILSCFDEPFLLDGRTLSIKVSVGVASAHGGVSGEQLMRNADAALYAVKAAGGGRHEVFGSALRLHQEERLSREAELHAALVNGAIVPWLQPVIDIETGQIVAAEALARWEHPDGVRTAATFIDVMHQVGLMAEFTEQLVSSVDGFQASLRSAGLSPVPISINVPCSHLEQLVGLEGLGPLIVEVTEETAVDDIAETNKRLAALRSAGHQVWLDDFGTGYSSMSIAARLPIDGLKIDREFVAELLSSRAVRGVIASMIELGRQLGVDVVAEGVEDFAQAQMLRQLGARIAQGHLWAPAVPFAEFVEWLSADFRFPVQPDVTEPAASS